MSQTKAQLIDAVDGSIVTADLADDAVIESKLANDAVGSGELKDNAVTTAKIADSTGASDGVTSAKIASNAVTTTKIQDASVTLAKLEHGTSSNDGKFLRANNGADPTFETVNTDLVSDTSPQLGGNLDGNGNTADFTGNTTSLGIPRGSTAQQPSAGSTEGHIRYDNDDNVIYFSDGSNWIKIAAAIPSISSITGNLFVGSASTLTLAGTNFLDSNLVVNFLQSSDSINVNVTVTPSSTTAATVTVPSSVFNNVTAGNVVTIKVTNADSVASNNFSKTAVNLASGGTITTYSSGGSNFRVHTFTSSSNFVATYDLSNVDYVCVAGGGAGGGQGGQNGNGGGGAGGYLQSQFGSVSAGTYAVVIGAGGTGVNATSGQTSGSNTTFNSLTAIGGGHGMSASEASESGGSGGGGTASSNGGGASGTVGQGNDGGSGNNNSRGGGGGGGAGAAGGNATSTNFPNGVAGAGGAGSSNSIQTGSSQTYAGGGGGSMADQNANNGAGGSGGGGQGGGQSNNPAPANGTANTGGGGGAGRDATGKNGGSGIVIVRYTL
jgi:hypothetical protein